jgi:hypothetical protein
MGGEGAEAVIDKRYPSYSMANAVGGKNPRASRRPNQGRKHSGNTPKDRDNRPKRLALLGRCSSR